MSEKIPAVRRSAKILSKCRPRRILTPRTGARTWPAGVIARGHSSSYGCSTSQDYRPPRTTVQTRGSRECPWRLWSPDPRAAAVRDAADTPVGPIAGRAILCIAYRARVRNKKPVFQLAYGLSGTCLDYGRTHIVTISVCYN